jgi:putative ABC transport system permease protein
MATLNLFYLIRQNIRRKPFRSIALTLSVAIAAATLFSGSLLMKSVENSIELGASRLGADVIVVPEGAETSAQATLLGGEPSTFYMDARVLDLVKGVDGVDKATPQVFLKTASKACCVGWNVLLIGFDPTTDLTVRPWVKESLYGDIGPDDLIIGGGFYWDKGAKLRFFGHQFDVVAKLEETGIGFFDNAAFIPIQTAYKMAEDSRGDADPEDKIEDLMLQKNQISAVLVKADEVLGPQRTAFRIENTLARANLEDPSIPRVKAIVSQEAISSVKDQLSSLLKGLFALSAVIWLMAMVMIGAVFSMIVNERKREIGLTRAMGATKGFVFRMVMGESVTLTSLGGALGVLVSGGVIKLLEDDIQALLKVPYVWPETNYIFGMMVLALGLSILTGIISALYPAFTSSRLEPYEAIRRGE